MQGQRAVGGIKDDRGTGGPGSQTATRRSAQRQVTPHLRKESARRLICSASLRPQLSSFTSESALEPGASLLHEIVRGVHQAHLLR